MSTEAISDLVIEYIIYMIIKLMVEKLEVTPAIKRKKKRRNFDRF
jgi:hypothetical protein